MRKWSIREGDHGGYKELVTRIEGSDVYKQLKRKLEFIEFKESSYRIAEFIPYAPWRTT